MMEHQVNRLLIAAKKGELAAVIELLDRGIHVDSGGEDSINALHMAVANDREDVVCLLLRCGASLDARTCYGWTPLMFATYYGHLRVTMILLRHTEPDHVDAQNHLGATALYCSARSGHVHIVDHLLEAGANVNGASSSTDPKNDKCNSTDPKNDKFNFLISPLMTAAQHGHEEMVALLINKGADVNYEDPTTGWTALMLAALNGRMAVVKFLTEHGSDISTTNGIKQTALDIASSRQNSEVESFLDRRTLNRPVQSGPRMVKPSIMELAKHGDVNGLKSLFQEAGGDQVNARDEEGATALMYASMRGHFSVVQLLIDHKADIDYQDKISGWTALMQAAYYRHKSVAKLLLDSGADVKVCAKNGCTAFDMASIIGDTDILRLVASASMETPSLSDTKLISPSVSDTKEKWISNKVIHSQQNTVDGYDCDMSKDHHKTWWSKVSGRFRNIGRTKLRVLEPVIGSQVCEVLTSKELSHRYAQGTVTGKTDLNITKKTLTSVLDSAIKVSGHNLKRPQALRVHLPDDVVMPVVPPSMRTAAFEFTRVQQREQHSPDGDELNLPVPSLCINGKIIPGLSEKRLLASLDNISSVSESMGNTRTRGLREGRMLTGSPDSSYSANSVLPRYTNSGSRTLNASSSPATDIPFFPIGSTTSSSLRQRSGRGCFSPSPTFMASPSTGPKSHQRNALGGRVDTASSTYWPISTGKLHHQHSMDISKYNGNEDGLADILEQLALEKYNPIFEEQEIDMEAFLTLNDGDLINLGVTQRGAREQILATVSELNSGKDRERQRLEESLVNFHSDKSQILTSGYGSVSPSNSFSRWMNTSHGFKTPP